MSVIARSYDDEVINSQSLALTAGNGDRVESSASWTEKRDVLIEFLREDYEELSIPVTKYLQRNSDLAWVLLGAKAALQEAFGCSVTVDLQLVSDPETNERNELLFAYIGTALPIGEGLKALNRFDQEWLLAKLERIGGRMGFDLRF